MGGQTLLWTLLILAIVHQSAYKLCRFSCTFILFFDVFFVSAVRILLLSNFCRLPLNYMQQEESLDLCSIVRSFFGPIVDFDQNLSSPEFIFVVMVIFLPLLFLPIGRVECTLLDLQKGIVFCWDFLFYTVEDFTPRFMRIFKKFHMAEGLFEEVTKVRKL